MYKLVNSQNQRVGNILRRCPRTDSHCVNPDELRQFVWFNISLQLSLLCKTNSPALAAIFIKTMQ